ncbi:MAG: Kae1-associated kinase Bud32 [Candidatus Diapherotrites archaeon]|uniref:non-specific serine/threonine protein kinase n=1 Tax=Candidatus Iainarchaeum sp. TaxID=3101447 RepID=A0A2D6LP65_9ARCH|nr:Kae1-associated kinase Bud32 [Candidatus Diapherotrites archaeon]|tara:strand:- start:1088 stop:1699 length:612 start_codon:yes stop_codon:yes gene_type:complete
MELIKQGAEAKLFKDTYLERECVVKQRQRKKYREKSLDERILKERIRTECNLLSKAKKAGIRTPIVWKVNLKDMEIVSEFISGKTLKEEFLSGNSEAEKLCKEAGQLIGKMHSEDLIHGDLTTSNIILHNDVLVFLDFGLGSISSKIEDKAVDLLVFKKTFMATHYQIIDLWKNIEQEYQKSFSNGKNVLKHLSDVEARARYY